ncbi:DUF2975 domain-containing protein [Lysinibacillus fusiformis]|uniref:DUF2975 domain-containing protein n=1 Tax=Lysinibacillus fusiformis TaxID=28031 RepID=UPI001967523B|nr:DUF2975 domain-containing protein [Lysinibacillus fusiformis]QSB09168.1 DUF2975 domain-containing protein [Lysinibacillus fusiformis]
MKHKKGSTLFLKSVIILFGIPVLALGLFWLPGVASRDAAAHPESSYLSYLFLIYVYTLCIPYYAALYQAYRLLTNIDQHQAFSESSIRALRTIKNCAFTIVLFLVLGIAAIMLMFTGKEDITGIITLSLISIFASSTIATFAAVLHRLLQKAMDLQCENELTV